MTERFTRKQIDVGGDPAFSAAVKAHSDALHKSFIETFAQIEEALLPAKGTQMLFTDKVVWFDEDGYHEKAVDIYDRRR